MKENYPSQPETIPPQEIPEETARGLGGASLSGVNRGLGDFENLMKNGNPVEFRYKDEITGEEKTLRGDAITRSDPHTKSGRYSIYPEGAIKAINGTTEEFATVPQAYKVPPKDIRPLPPETPRQ